MPGVLFGYNDLIIDHSLTAVPPPTNDQDSRWKFQQKPEFPHKLIVTISHDRGYLQPTKNGQLICGPEPHFWTLVGCDGSYQGEFDQPIYIMTNDQFLAVIDGRLTLQTFSLDCLSIYRFQLLLPVTNRVVIAQGSLRPAQEDERVRGINLTWSPSWIIVMMLVLAILITIAAKHHR